METILAVEAFTRKPLNFYTLDAAISALRAPSANVPKNMTCTNCVKALYSLSRLYLGEDEHRSWDNYFVKNCGPSFIGAFCIFLGLVDTDLH